MLATLVARGIVAATSLSGLAFLGFVAVARPVEIARLWLRLLIIEGIQQALVDFTPILLVGRWLEFVEVLVLGVWRRVFTVGLGFPQDARACRSCFRGQEASELAVVESVGWHAVYPAD